MEGLSGGALMDCKEFPGRSVEEPPDGKVLRGSHDGFVEAAVLNMALLRRRIRDPRLTMEGHRLGSRSKTDAVLCYLDDKADPKLLADIREKLKGLDVNSLSMAQESLAEAIRPRQWYNPFPKVRTTGRPDAACAQLLEGSVILLIDNSPEVLILPTSIFDFLQETNDFYFPPLTGGYLRIVRQIVFFFTLFLTPLWYLLTRYPSYVPDFLTFALPDETGKLPLIVQLLLVEFLIDGLRLASMNTPDMLSNSLSVVGGLILGDFAVEIGWLIPEVILYMAFVAIANFSQRSYQLGYAFKFLRILLLILTALFGLVGFLFGVILITALLLSNRTVNGKRSYLDPLVPLRPRALRSILLRRAKGSD
jgi:stage V sporulation protein AF